MIFYCTSMDLWSRSQFGVNGMNEIDDIKRLAGITESDSKHREIVRAFMRSGIPLIQEMIKADGSFTTDDLEKINSTVTTIGAWVQKLAKQTPEYQELDD
jgi:hypothetical protein